jgi:hypothetical protein
MVSWTMRKRSDERAGVPSMEDLSNKSRTEPMDLGSWMHNWKVLAECDWPGNCAPQTIRGNAGGIEKQYTCWLDFGASDERNSRLQSSLVGVTSLVAGRV